jgi:hypothetical protein
MKTFITYILIFCVPILVAGILCEWAIRRIPNDYKYKRAYLDSNADKIETLFLGGSHVFYGIIADRLNCHSFNAAYISQSIDYDLMILKKYSNKWRNLKCIVIQVDYFTLFSKLSTGTEAWRIKDYNIYYHLITPNNIADYSEMLSNSLKVNIYRIYNYYYHKESSITCSRLGWGGSYNSKGNKNLTTTGLTAAKRHTFKNWGLLDQNVEILNTMIQFAKKRNIKIIVFTSPAYKTYTENLDKNQLTTTVSEAIKVVSTYKDAVYYNLLNDTAFKKNDFYDADHLNEIGAKKLTEKMSRLIKLAMMHNSNDKKSG